MSKSPTATELRNQILELVKSYHEVAFPKQEFQAGTSSVPCAGRVFGAEEIVSLVDSSLDFWLTTGRFADEFEKRFAKVFGTRHCLLVNSGSSANLLAIAALTSPKLGDKRLKPGDEVITVAAGFPTTVNPILQNQLVPVFVDVHIPTYNIDVTQLEAALTPKTRAIMIAHTLGNPFDLATVSQFAKDHDLWLIEDCCDALGARFNGQHVGTFGDIATCSFYPAHHITMGEGGAVMTNQPKLKTFIESFRDWGRDCWCAPGVDNTCGKRFDWELGELPHGYDHKYIYSHIGYNLKATDMQAAVGVAQLDRLSEFIAARNRNYAQLHATLKPYEEFLVLPEATANSEPSWFGFPLAVRPGSPFSRRDLVRHLDQAKIGTRQIFGGNLIRQPAYVGQPMRIIGDLPGADFVMRQAFWVGVYPGITESAMRHLADSIIVFIEGQNDHK
jgi:CDP-6-deoxy-D-xylo-4-hexulose-3-dehydrase